MLPSSGRHGTICQRGNAPPQFRLGAVLIAEAVAHQGA